MVSSFRNNKRAQGGLLIGLEEIHGVSDIFRAHEKGSEGFIRLTGVFKDILECSRFLLIFLLSLRRFSVGISERL